MVFDRTIQPDIIQNQPGESGVHDINWDGHLNRKRLGTGEDRVDNGHRAWDLPVGIVV
jgi:hypothetical protein